MTLFSTTQHKLHLRIAPALIGLSFPGLLYAQNALVRSTKQLEYRSQIQVNAGKGATPLWLTANRYGLSSVTGENGLLRAGLTRSTQSDSTYKWRIGYGIDMAVAYNYTSTAIVNQLYADIEYKLVRLTIGAKEEPMALKNAALSSGSQTFGINARPVPQIRLSLPEYWNITGKGNWAAIKGFIGYGMLTDGRFQADYAAPDAHYARKALYHAKAGYLRLGNESKFPLTFEGGLEMATVFGGTIYNARTWNGISQEPIHMGHGFKDFMDATFGIGGDITDGNGYTNATGNTLGSWVFRLNYAGKGWRASVYYDHFFEDHSQMFFEYGWKDGLYGVEIQFPQNPVISGLVYEHLNTTYQSGPLYHDHTPTIPDQISGVDNYYNHNLYAGWQHWGQTLGNPLFISPLYNKNGDLTFTANRFKAHHLGISGQPLPQLSYRLLYTHERSIGNYGSTQTEAQITNSFLAEAHFNPEKIGRLNTKGWGASIAVAFDKGDLLGDNLGFSLTITKSGLLTN